MDALGHELVKVIIMQETKEQNKSMVKRYFQAWNNRDFKAMREMLAPDYQFTLLTNPPNTISREKMLGFAQSMTLGIPDLKVNIHQMVAEGDTVVVRSTLTGTHEGDFQGQPATGNRIEVSSMFTCRVKNGRIVDEKEIVDTLGFSEQLKPKEERPEV